MTERCSLFAPIEVSIRGHSTPETVATNTFLLICFHVEMREMDDIELMRHTAQDYMKI